MYTYGLMFWMPVNFIYAVGVLITGVVKRRRKEYYFFAAIFCLYMNVLINRAFFPIFTEGAKFYENFSKYVNLDISQLLTYTPYQIIGNFLMTFPLGILLVFIINGKLYFQILYSVLASVLIEFIQLLMIISLHLVDMTFDVNDIILNAAGCLFGHLVFYFFCKVYMHIQGNASSLSLIKYFNRVCDNYIHKRDSLDGLSL